MLYSVELRLSARSASHGRCRQRTRGGQRRQPGQGIHRLQSIQVHPGLMGIDTAHRPHLMDRVIDQREPEPRVGTKVTSMKVSAVVAFKPKWVVLKPT
jgi:hypothetical protein